MCLVLGDKEVGEPTHEVTSYTCAIAQGYCSSNNRKLLLAITQHASLCIVIKTPIVDWEHFTNSHPIVVQPVCCLLVSVRDWILFDLLKAQHAASTSTVTLPTGRAPLADMCMLQALLA
jgi:hypothetical protein